MSNPTTTSLGPWLLGVVAFLVLSCVDQLDQAWGLLEGARSAAVVVMLVFGRLRGAP